MPAAFGAATSLAIALLAGNRVFALMKKSVTIDGTPPGADHGGDTDDQGTGVVKEYRLYQLIRQKGKVEHRTFEIEFLDPGVQAFAFTFG